MSWADVIARGSGAIAYRLVIAGHPLEFVSASSLIGAGTDDRERIGGLEARSIQWSETLDPAAVKLRASGFTARIVDDGSHRTGDSFVRQPSRINYLTSSVTSGTVAIPMANTNHANGDIFYLGNECFKITSGGGTAAPSCSGTRGYRDSIATAHFVDPTLGLSRPEITFEEPGQYNGRPSIEGSLAYLYAYGDGETGTGTLVWRGIVAAQPKLRDLTVWEVELDSVASVLDQTLGADLAEPSVLRGINYDNLTAPQFQISILSGADYDGAVQHTATVGGADLAGYYETQEEFCDALNALIRAASSGWGTHALNRTSGDRPTLIAAPTDTGAWRFVYNTPSSSHRWCNVATLNETTARIDPVYTDGGFPLTRSDGVRVFSVASSESYYPYSFELMEGAGTVPRGFLGYHTSRTIVFTDTVYLGGTLSLTTDDTVALEWPAFNGFDAVSRQYNVISFDTTTRSAKLSLGVVPRGVRSSVFRYYTAAGVPTLTTSRSYINSGPFSDFIFVLINDSPEFSATGRMPLVTGEHIDNTGLATTIASITAGRDWLASRSYLGTSDVALAKMIEEECKLYGLVPSITTDGRLSFVPFRVGAATEATSYTVDETKNLSGAQMPGFEPSAFGLLNTIQLRTGFDPKTGKHIGRTFVVRDSAALSRNPLPRMMKIEPRSSWADDLAIPYSEVLAMAQTWLGVLGAAYQTITVACRLDAIDAVIGSQVAVSVAQLPNTLDGGRGITLASGVVIGRRVRPLDAIVELTVLTTQVRVAGYAPSSLVDTVTLVSGSTYDIVLDATQPPGYATTSTWQIGDVIQVSQYDATSPTSVTGTVTTVDAITRTVTATLSGAAPSGTLTLEYRSATVVAAQQERYAFIALEDGTGGNVIEFTSGNVAPRQFAS
jgi:hypothetical protein